jgi:CCR4-NOT transcription complex subunit 4
MWCWHRIRESESGLCPACRTPYGDDPHEFSAVDVEEVLKANKEKEAAAKRERVKQQQNQQQQQLQPQQNQQSQPQNLLQQQHLQQQLSSDGEGDNASGGANRGPMDVPKDRTQLANMRVIRRNLVYAVGLPPSIANEETLRKPEYFGQYGKIVKIVLNRSQITGDPRRASASAYVTFAHKVSCRNRMLGWSKPSGRAP